MRHNFLATMVKDGDVATLTLPETVERLKIVSTYFIIEDKFCRENNGNVIDVSLPSYAMRPTFLMDVYKTCKRYGYNYELINCYNNNSIIIPIKNLEDALPAPDSKKEKEKESVLLNLTKRLINKEFRGSVVDLQIARERQIEEGYLQIKSLFLVEDF